jgi:hypothetical protein
MAGRCRWLGLAVLALLVLAAPAAWAQPARARAPAGTCAGCHRDLAAVLPAGHPAVARADITACHACHPLERAGKAAARPYVARLHVAHLGDRPAACTVCHTWTPGKAFGVRGARASWGAPSKDQMELVRQTVVSWRGSAFLDRAHGRAGVTCSGCHGAKLPAADDTVENARCLECHGPIDRLAQASAPADFPDRNPHRSHLGDIACTVCHRAHGASKVYCLDCHRLFKMTIPGAATG